MIEIAGLKLLYEKLATMAEGQSKSRSWAVLGPVLWIVGEIAGFVYGFGSGNLIGFYAWGLAGAAAGAALAWTIVANLDVLDGDASTATSSAHQPRRPAKRW